MTRVQPCGALRPHPPTPLCAHVQALMATWQWSPSRHVEPLPLFPARPIASNLSQLHLPRMYEHADQLLFAPCQPIGGDDVWTVAQNVSAALGASAVCLPCAAASQCGVHSMDSYYSGHRSQVLAGLVFNTSTLLAPGTSVGYTIRLDGGQHLPKLNGSDNMVPAADCLPDANMVYNAIFLPVQVAVEGSIVAARSNNSAPAALWHQVSVQRFPGAGCVSSTKMRNLGRTLPYVLVLLVLSLLWCVHTCCGATACVRACLRASVLVCLWSCACMLAWSLRFPLMLCAGWHSGS